MPNTDIYLTVRASLFIALAIIFPMLFHMIGLGSTFLPMFLPIMLAGIFLTWKYAVTVAILAPIISYLMTGMPPIVPPVLPIMLVELGLIALSLSLLYVHYDFTIWLALPVAIAIDRFVLWLAVVAIAPLLGFDHPLFSIGLVMSGIPGILMQLIVIPLILNIMRKTAPTYFIQNRNQRR
ncbi:MAG: ECF transporter S component [Deferribacteres bacterium]|nr:ECF transporter S component [candidate division KSB1 bacterium]MCB9501834.1 ECF transporter S component [Deferribacteres bacterium]